MKLIRLFAALALATIVSSCGSIPGAAGQVAGHTAFAKIQRSNEPGWSQPFFGRYRLSSGWKEVNPATAAAIAAEIDEALAAHAAELNPSPSRRGDEPIRLNPFCIPDPGFAVRIPAGSGNRDVAICLECGFMVVRDPNGRTTEFFFDDALTARIRRHYDDFLGGKP